MAPMDFPAAGYLSDYLAFWAIWLAIVGATVFFFRRTRGRPGRLRLVAGNLLVLLSLLWTAVVAAETYLRYIYDATDSYALMLTNFSSPAITEFAPCSNGSRIETPIEFARPAPSMPACMIPGPAPVMTIHPCAAR